MEKVQDILSASLLWRALTALCLWFGEQWQNSRVIQAFLHPGPSGQAMSEQSLVFHLWQRLRSLLGRLYQLLRLDRLFDGSIFLRSFFWCALAAFMAPILPTMAALALTLVAYASLFLNLMRRREQPLRYAPMNKYLLLFAAVYLAAAFTSVTPRGSLKPAILFICFTLFALVVENTAVTRRQLERFTALLVLSAAVVSLIGICQYLFGVTGADAWVDNDMFPTITTRVFATLQNPNMLAQYLFQISLVYRLTAL